MSKNTLRKLVDSLKKKNPDLKKFGLLTDEGVQVPQEVFSTGSLALDYRINYGGIPRAKITHMYGPERSLKTTIALLASIDALNKHPEGFVVFVDFERNYDTIESRNHLRYLGFTDEMLSERFVYLRDNPEECFNAVEELIRSEHCLTVIVDSVGGMISGHAYDKKYEEHAKMGQQPTLISNILRRLNNANQNAAIMLLNQARDVIGGPPGYGGPQYTFSGGRTLKHLIHLGLDLKGYHKKADKEKESSNELILLNARIDKCKVGGENSTTQIEYNLTHGAFNVKQDCLILGRELGIINNAGGWYYLYDGVNGGSGDVLLRVQGGENFENTFKASDELCNHVEEVIRAEIAGKTTTINWLEREQEYIEEDVPESEEVSTD